MLFCDIGNTTYHFFDGKNSYKESIKSFDPSSITQEVFFICVVPDILQKLQHLPNWKNLEVCIDRKKYYDTMGIDRIVACEAIDNGVIIDAGSAITVDVVKNSEFVGGFIYPGVNIMHTTYKNISKLLDYKFNFEVNLSKLPKTSKDAVSYGYLKGFYLEVTSYNIPVVLTGGDAKLIHQLLPDATIDENLLFRSMKKLQKVCFAR